MVKEGNIGAFFARVSLALLLAFLCNDKDIMQAYFRSIRSRQYDSGSAA